MARSQSPESPHNHPILSQLRSARTVPEQTAALRALKNEIVGHAQKKELWIGLGVLEPIVRTLASGQSHLKQNGKDARLPVVQRALSDEESVRLQALQLVASFANGGPPFLAPLHAARVLPAILTNLSPFTNAPQLVIAALRALTDIAEASALAMPSSTLTPEILADSLFVPLHVDSLCALLSISSANPIQQSQVALAAGLISRLCREDRHQQLLATSGALDALASRLASFAVAEGHVVPGADAVAQSDGLFEAFPQPAPQTARIGPILEAIAVMLGDSKYRAYRFIGSPSILSVFPSIKFEPPKGLSDSSLDVNMFTNSRQSTSTAMEYILPSVHVKIPSTPASRFSSSQPSHSQSRSSSRASLSKFAASAPWESPHLQSTGAESEIDEVESPLIPWLVYLVRSCGERERLMAASILASLIKAGVANKAARETSLGLLVVPLLVQMMDENTKENNNSQEELTAAQRAVLEHAPTVLARLILDSDYLQTAAHDCGGVGALSRLLKYAYKPIQTTDSGPTFWSPQPDTGMDIEHTSPLTQLGEHGQNQVLAHRLKVRESTLKGIAALAAGKEDYRKCFLEHEIIPYVVESLSEYPRKPRSTKERADKSAEDVRSRPLAGFGTNPVPVIIAACHVVRMLSRSISILRTALVDHGVALPVFRFLKHPDVDVQVAATAAICNLVVEVSPVRELLAENGVMKVLCEHAHSDNPALRLNALWALKHFADAVGPDMKKACLEELESGWLVQLICEDTEDSALHTAQSRESSGVDMDDDTDMQPEEEVHRWLYGSKGLLRELDSSRSTKLRQTEDKLNAVRETELNPVRRARNDDLAIQEQGLDLIRNLIGRPGAGSLTSDSPTETTEMIDYLFSELGQDRLFEILATKLRPKVFHPFSRRTPVAGREPRILYPKAKIIVAVIYILVHMAASIPRHRQLVIAQTELLKLLAQQASSTAREVRVALCHLIINLTWQDDENEAQACAQRAHELRKLGFHTKMETLKHQDGDLDVRERAKTASWQMQHATAY